MEYGIFYGKKIWNMEYGDWGFRRGAVAKIIPS